MKNRQVFDHITPANDLTRNYGNWFPTLSYANAFGPVHIMLNYSAKTRRPNYANLSSAVRYNSRYIWQSGNAGGLLPEPHSVVGFKKETPQKAISFDMVLLIEKMDSCASP